MTPAIWLGAALIGAGQGASRQAPSYSAAGVVNAASNQVGAFAPNTFVSIYGRGLAWDRRGLSSEDVSGDQLPTVLSGTGARVWIGQIAANVYYASPEQINVLIPSNMRPGPTQLRVQVDSTYGPAVDITLGKTAPALFQMSATSAIAVRANGKVATAESPARPGEVVVLYATGLGPTTPSTPYGKIPHAVAPINELDQFQIRFEGKPVNPGKIYYAGVAPGFAGLYQINVEIPADVGDDPEVRILASGAISPEGVRIPVRR